MAFSVTTPIYYVNSDPHLGHAYTTVAADVLARHHRQRGEDVFFLTGTDEHGGKVAQAAAEAGLSPKEFCDQVSARFRHLVEQLNATNDYFIRTTDAEHERRVQDFLVRLRDRGHLYEDTYAGLYCTGCEQFYAEKDLEQPGNICPLHKRPVEWLEEENTFFRLSSFQDALIDLYDRDPEYVVPRTRYNEARSQIEAGLTDLSVSRASVSWGVPLPWKPEQTIYVWVDALLNYHTALEYGVGRDVSGQFWPSLHLLGKDILRLHCVLWPALLLAAGYDPPRKLFVHGYLTSGEQKMSKSLGNVIDPLGVISDLGADALRFYVLREVQWGQDGSVTRDGLDRRYEGELANDLGNLVSRTTAMLGRYRDGRVPAGESELEPVHERVLERFDALDLTGALEEIWTLVRAANRYVEERAPWTLARSDAPADAAALDRTLYTLADAVRALGVLLHPFIPAASERILDAIGDPGALGWDRAGLGLLEEGTAVTQPPPLFPRVADAA
ncbi:MAG TPA: methionine--tRNA ligase [Gaiellales bacterium]|jgi:methionyl-tRNA synthetase|nr:methionine--tRNA ligase [Gaiellales bacterium]